MACHEGARAALKFGYKNVFIMSAGIQGWRRPASRSRRATLRPDAGSLL